MTAVTLPRAVAKRPERATLVRAVCVREWREALGNKLLVGMTLLPPIVILAAGIVAVGAAAANPPSERDVQALYAAAPAVQGLDPTEAVQGFIATYFLILFMLIPTVVPLTMAIYSVIGEKSARTLEPLLAAPVSAAELVLGKSLASVVPAVAITWLSFAVFVAAVDAVAWPLVHGPVLPNGMWLFGVGVVAPLFAFLGNGLAVLVSARVGEARLAQQLSALVVLPLMALVGGQLAGWIRAGTGYYAVQGAVVLVLDVLLVRASVRLFDRERLVSRWS